MYEYLQHNKKQTKRFFFQKVSNEKEGHAVVCFE